MRGAASNHSAPARVAGDQRHEGIGNHLVQLGRPHDEHGQGDERHPERVPVQVRHRLRPGRDEGEEPAAGLDRRAQEPQRLAHENVAAHPHEHSADHGDGQPVHEPAEAQRPERDLQQAGQHDDRERLRQVVGVGADNDRREDGHDRAGPGDHRRGTAEYRGEEPHRDRAVEGRHRPEPGQHAEPQRHRHHHHRGHDPAEHVPLQVIESVLLCRVTHGCECSPPRPRNGSRSKRRGDAWPAAIVRSISGSRLTRCAHATRASSRSQFRCVTGERRHSRRSHKSKSCCVSR